jgi:hypothetical protein
MDHHKVRMDMLVRILSTTLKLQGFNPRNSLMDDLVLAPRQMSLPTM